MCGIAGIIALDGRPVDVDVLRAMSARIRHRGPDDEGYVLVDARGSEVHQHSGRDSIGEVRARFSPLGGGSPSCIGLAHRRFSIIDLSAAGHQPFVDEAGEFVLAFNGEIYNYVELRQQLEAAGAHFRSTSDTEVFLQAYRHWGAECFARLNGFWAAAIYDVRRRSLVLSRDRMGKKPLYWTKVGSAVYFASEIKALLAAPEVRALQKVNESVAARWIVYGVKDLDAETFFEGVYSFPASSHATIDEGFPANVRTYWYLPAVRLRERDVPVTDASAEIVRLLESAIDLRMRADVPVGVELSGGMDSSSIAALAARRQGTVPVSYTVRFPDEAHNEEPFARAVAEHCGLRQVVLDPPSIGFWERVLEFTWLHEEPYHSPNLDANQRIWAQMRQAGTKVSLNGAAGDECFAGYGTDYAPAQLELLTRGALGRYWANAAGYASASTARAVVAPLRFLARQLREALPGAAHEAARLLTPHGRRVLPHYALETFLSRSLYTQMTSTLMPYWLRAGDTNYMGVPIEVRAPFLDYRLVEFAFRLPAGYLVRDGWHKWILRKAMEPLLPAGVVWRTVKMGFPFPYADFVSVNAGKIRQIVDQSAGPILEYGRRAEFAEHWRVLSFILWYQLFLNGNRELFARIGDPAPASDPARTYTPAFVKTCDISD